MGGLCSKNSLIEEVSSNPYANGNGHQVDVKKHESTKQQQQQQLQSVLNPPLVKQLQEEPTKILRDVVLVPEDFYDGIPRFDNDKDMHHKSRSKVSEVGSRLGRAGLGKAKDVLDTLGSSMTNLNPSSGFVSGAAAKGNELAILAFEVANTIVKGSNLMHSLSKGSIRHVKQVVLVNKGVQNLVSKDMDELLKIVAADKREELSVFSGEVVRFGNRCKDPQWHNLDRYFDKVSTELSLQDSLKEEAEMVIAQLMTLVQHTAELYQELQILERFQQDYQRKHHEEEVSVSSQKGNSLTMLKAELKSQRKLVKILKKKSLWSRSLEDVMGKLVDIVHFLFLQIHSEFGSEDGQLSTKGSVGCHQRLGPSGLSLHYANIVMQIDSLVARSCSVPTSTRNTLYQSLPPDIKSALRSKLQSFHVQKELTVTEIKAEMEKTLHWLVPIATNTAKAHHGFGWVGEWANTGSDNNRKSASGTMDVIRIETLHHADMEKMDTYILDQVLWLNYLISRSMDAAQQSNISSQPIKAPNCVTSQKPNQEPRSHATSLTTEDQLLLESVGRKRPKNPNGQSRSLDFDFERTRLRKNDRLSKSASHPPVKVKKGPVSIKRMPSGVPLFSFKMEKQKALDIIDRLDALVR
ncbi:protein PSK SIMULATOR 1-like [Rutidosis leptorrhynchoides]|uniref:protein PSK SIMULATOR 1-like n=1 Tax=Rutidosis leptorrhynchoides TaxID=125765 RepID=UPI003A9998E3